MDNIVLKIPYGTRDFLPDEAKEKRFIENKIADLFAKWGYKEVVTPTMEYLDTLIVRREPLGREPIGEVCGKG